MSCGHCQSGPTMQMQTRRLKGFAVIERPAGALILGTFRADPESAWNAFYRHNPKVFGYPQQAQTVEVEIFIHEALGGQSECKDLLPEQAATAPKQSID